MAQQDLSRMKMETSRGELSISLHECIHRCIAVSQNTLRYSLREPFHFAEITQQGASMVKERRELLEAHRHNVSLELQAMQQTVILIDATIAQYRRLNVNR
jgi:hypothetical protein